MKQNRLQSRYYGLLDYLDVLPILYFICALIRFFGYGLLLEMSTPDIDLESGWGWDWLLTFGIACIDFCRAGILLYPLCFLIIFGKHVVSSWQLLCRDASELSRSTVVNRHSQFIRIRARDEAMSVIVSPICGAELVEIFVQVKAAFEIYSNIGGAFVFALVADVGTWVFYLSCTVLFNEGNLELSSMWLLR